MAVEILACWASVATAQQPAPSADSLAQAAVDLTGDPYALSELHFTFVVEAAGTEKARRTHTWRPQDATVVVQSGGTTTRFEGLGTTDPSLAVADPASHTDIWARVSLGTPPEQAAKAWSQWINDSYWLLAPAKVLDAGAHRSLTENGQLELTFGEVGVTPGDRYELDIDPATGVLRNWSFTLQSGRAGTFSWAAPVDIGPLKLSPHRENAAGDFVIRFEDLRATP